MLFTFVISGTNACISLVRVRTISMALIPPSVLTASDLIFFRTFQINVRLLSDPTEILLLFSLFPDLLQCLQLQK